MTASCSTNMISVLTAACCARAYALDGLICLNDTMFKLKPKMECLYETKLARR
jgi:hypothetical protein